NYRGPGVTDALAEALHHADVLDRLGQRAVRQDTIPELTDLGLLALLGEFCPHVEQHAVEPRPDALPGAPGGGVRTVVEGPGEPRELGRRGLGPGPRPPGLPTLSTHRVRVAQYVSNVEFIHRISSRSQSEMRRQSSHGTRSRGGLR